VKNDLDSIIESHLADCTHEIDIEAEVMSGVELIEASRFRRAAVLECVLSAFTVAAGIISLLLARAFFNAYGALFVLCRLDPAFISAAAQTFFAFIVIAAVLIPCYFLYISRKTSKEVENAPTA